MAASPLPLQVLGRSLLEDDCGRDFFAVAVF